MSLTLHASWTQPPLFLHGLWRSSSTYFWNKINSLPGYVCYYEPFHENLALSSTRVLQTSPDRDLMRHPRTDGHYFGGYTFAADQPLANFRPEFSFESFCMAPDDRDEALACYVQGLIADARCRGLIPAFQPNRSALRIRWLQREFGGHHWYLLRDPCAQWASFKRFANLYFPAATLLAVQRSKHHPIIASLRAAERIPYYAEERVHPTLKRYMEYAADCGEQRLQDAFNALWLAGLHEALAAGAQIVDVSALANPRVRAALARRLAETALEPRCAPDFDLDDFAAPDPGEDHLAVNHQMAQLRAHIEELPRTRLAALDESSSADPAELSERNQELVAQLLERCSPGPAQRAHRSAISTMEQR